MEEDSEATSGLVRGSHYLTEMFCHGRVAPDAGQELSISKISVTFWATVFWMLGKRDEEMLVLVATESQELTIRKVRG